tara:strand:- start:6747 stop:7073 length:327 start_codon:yes stop_codon:yes gene_type:complete
MIEQEDLPLRIKELESLLAEKEEQLSYYQGRGQRILDLTARRCLEALEDDENPPTAAMINTIRQFLKDQNVIDLRNGSTPTNHLLKKYPFAESPDDSADFGVRETSNG